MNVSFWSARVFFGLLLALAPEGPRAEINLSQPEREFDPTGPNDNKYRLVDLENDFDPGPFMHCHWGVFQHQVEHESDEESSKEIALYYGDLTDSPQTELFLSTSMTTLESWDLLRSLNPSWEPNESRVRFTSHAPGTTYTLFRKLHFSNAFENGASSATEIGINTRNLIVLIHGWNSSGSRDAYSGNALAGLAQEIVSQLQPSAWQLVQYRWEKDADTGPVINSSPPYLHQENAPEAAESAHLHGQHLGELIEASCPQITRVHLIAHSAGAWAARSTARHLLAKTAATVQVTLLDPFIPGDILFSESSLTEEIMSQIAGFQGNQRLFHLENIFAVDNANPEFYFLTLEKCTDFLNYATSDPLFWGDGCDQRVDWSPSGIPDLGPALYYDSHDGPIDYYSDTVIDAADQTPSLPSLQNPAFDLDRAGWRASLFFNEPIFVEGPSLTPSTASVSETVVLSATVATRRQPGGPFTDGTIIWFEVTSTGQTNEVGRGTRCEFVATAAHNGREYFCEARNATGPTTSAPNRLTVRAAGGFSVPAAPWGLTAKAISSSQINLSWSHNSINVTAFKLQRRPWSSTAWTDLPLVGANGRSFANTAGLSPATKYIYRVCAMNGAVFSAYSAEASDTTYGGGGSVGIWLGTEGAPIGAPMFIWAGALGFSEIATPTTRYYPRGTRLTVVAPSRLSSGPYFQRWLVDGAVAGTGPVLDVNADAVHLVTGVFGPSQPNRALQSLAIEGPPSVDERSTAAYKTKATYEDGTTGYVNASWSDNSSYASMSGNGLLDASAVSSDRTIEIEATFSSGGVTKTRTKSVTILNKDVAATYTLTRNTTVGGRIGQSPQGDTFAAGTVVSLHANRDGGYVFSHWSGNASGSEDDITIRMDGDRSVTAHFIPNPSIGSLRVNLLPAQAASEGAQWKYRNYTAWRPSGDTQDAIPPGDGEVHFEAIPGWESPDSISTEVIGGQTVVVNATYREILGGVQVTIYPEQARAAGARWRLDGGSWMESTVPMLDVSPGAHSVEFRAVEGWTVPNTQTVTVERGLTAIASGEYGAPAGTPVITSVSPRTGPLSGGTTVTIDGVNFLPGATVTFGGVPAESTTVVSPTRITAITPPRDAYGTVPLTLVSGGTTVVQPTGFSYLNPLGANIELVGQIGGNIQAVAVAGNTVYYGEGPGLVVADFTNPAAPVERGRIPLPGTVLGIAVTNNIAFVAANAPGLYAIDVSTPTAPSIVGLYDTDGAACGVALLGGRAYIADATAGLQILSVTNPASIVRLGSLDTQGIARRVAAASINSRQYAFVAESDRAMRVIDVTVPSSPVEITNVPPQGSGITDVKIVGTTLYVSDWSYGVKIFNASNPSNLVQIGQRTGVGGGARIDVVGDRLYASSGGDLRVANLTVMPNPTILGTLFDIASFTEDIVVANGLAFLAGRDGLAAVSVSNPSAMSVRSSLPALNDTEDVWVSGNVAFVGKNDGLQAIDVTNPARPVRLGSLSGDRVTDLVVTNGIATLVDYGEQAVRIANVSNPSSMSLAGTYSGVEAWNVALKGATPILAAATPDSSHFPKIDALNLSTPSNPRSMGSLTLNSADGIAVGITTASNWAFVGRPNQALDIVNISNLAAPQKVGSVAISDFFMNVAASEDGDYAYIPTDRGIQVVDVRVKSAPVLGQTIDPPQTSGSYMESVEVAGNRLIADEGGCFFVFDISQPDSPRILGYHGLAGSSPGIDIEGDLVFVAGYSAGVTIFRVLDVDKPTVAITEPTANSTYECNTELLSLGGAASDDKGVARVTWQNSRGGGGTADGTTNWTITGVALSTGENVLTVTVEDDNGNLGTDTLTVMLIPQDTTPPVVTITSPSQDGEFTTEETNLTLSGSAMDNQSVSGVSWTSSSGQNGNCSRVGDLWSIADMPLDMGPNILTVMASDASGNSGSNYITILRLEPDGFDPSVSILFPTEASEFLVDEPFLDISGQAADDRGLSRINWRNSRGGEGPVSGMGEWHVNGIPLQPGVNAITVTAKDTSGRVSEDSLSVTYRPYDADGDGIADLWEEEHFGGVETAGFGTDFGGRGVPDFLKFAFGMNPQDPDRNHLPRANVQAFDGDAFLTFMYRQLVIPRGLTYVVGVSSNLVDWDYSESQIEQIGAPILMDDGLTEEVTVRFALPIEEAGRCFLRLQAIQSP